ncbi:arabinose transporter [Carnimonas bestiolae]|uniref:arabinose transporter n=1 Tax=Carnimonas bestiolae TaxID=3402172 RepID=UPI003EDCA6BB
MSATSLPDDHTFKRRLMGIAVALFLTYLTIALPLPILTVFVTHHLGLSNSLGGLSIGIAFLSTIFTRPYFGAFADKHGGKYTLGWGMLLYVAGGLVCLLAAVAGLSPLHAYAVLLTGRLIIGVGESMAMVGGVAWGLAMAGPHRSGRVLGWIGMALYGAFAVGSPLGVWIDAQAGFVGVMLASAAMPVVGFLLTRVIPKDVPVAHSKRPSLLSVLPIIWKPSTAVLLQGIGFAAIGAFVAPLFIAQHWQHMGMGLSLFGVGFVISRILFSHLPDRIGGFKVAYASLVVEAIGQYLLWAATNQWLALVGALLTGLGCSMIFPAMGLEVVKRVPAQLRGTAMGGFSAFQDLAYGLTGPLVGLFVGGLGYSFAFLIGGIAATLGLAMVLAAAKEPSADTLA